MNEKKVWVVEEGSYSNYHVVGVFSCRKNAKLIASKINGSTIASRTLDPCVKELNEGLNSYFVWMKRDGEVERCERIDDVSGCDLEGKTYLWKRSKAPAYKGKNDVLNSTVWARDEQHAIKIVNEKRAQMIANRKWK